MGVSVSTDISSAMNVSHNSVKQLKKVQELFSFQNQYKKNKQKKRDIKSCSIGFFLHSQFMWAHANSAVTGYAACYCRESVQEPDTVPQGSG